MRDTYRPTAAADICGCFNSDFTRLPCSISYLYLTLLRLPVQETSWTEWRPGGRRRALPETDAESPHHRHASVGLLDHTVSGTPAPRSL